MENINSQSTPTREPSTNSDLNISQTPPPVRKKSKIIYVLIALFVIIFLGSATTFGMKYFSNSKNETVMISTPTPTITLDPTADWKTYEGYGFEIKYPPSWNISEDLINTNQIAPEFITEIVDQDTNKPVKITILKISKEQYDSSRDVDSFVPIVYKELENNGYIYVLMANTYLIGPNISDDTAEKAKTAFDQILPTFKFTRQNMTSTTSTPGPTLNWKAFVGDDFRFSFPNQWQDKNASLTNMSVYINGDVNNSFGFSKNKRVKEIFSDEIGTLEEYLQLYSYPLNYQRSEVNINNIKFYKFISNPNIESKSIRYLTSKGDYVYEFYLNYNDMKNIALLDQILSTFKFSN